MACPCGSVCLCPARFTSASQPSRWTDVVDACRDVAAQVDLRPYLVSFVHVRWTGGKRGDGVEEVVTARPILPVPKVGDLGGITRALSLAQIDEAGTVLIDKISGAYSEDQILCRPSSGRPLPPAESIYYEIVLAGGGERRRLVPVGGAAPTFHPTRGWAVTVTLQAGARQRSGANRGG